MNTTLQTARAMLVALVLLVPHAPRAQAQAQAGNVAVLFVGNSLTYVNNLPALYSALANGQQDGTRYRADLIAAPGGTLAERWRDGVAAREIASGRWQVLVLQERGGTLSCLAIPEQRGHPDCVASLSAHRRFAELARSHGVQVVVLGTWGPDAIWQRQLSRGLRQVAKTTEAHAVDAGPILRRYASAHPDPPPFLDAVLHPSLDASLLLAALLYREIAARPPRAADLELAQALWPVRARIEPDRLASQQEQIAGDGRVTKISAARLQPLLAELTP